jgi:sensor histidine kinase regulating citrate/malate metabolism
MTNISKSFQDYDDNDPLLDRRKKRWEYWAALKKLRHEYMQTLDELNGQFDAYDFEDYIEANYGIKMNLVDGNITDDYIIMDEKKYLIFLLKFQ